MCLLYKTTINIFKKEKERKRKKEKKERKRKKEKKCTFYSVMCLK